ncbi:unnamed protein product, partial [Adineta ricciae]
MIKISLLYVFTFIAQADAQNIHSLAMSITNDHQLQCSNTTCLPFLTFIALDIHHCQIKCLTETPCEAATFHKVTSNCELLANISQTIGNMSVNLNTVTMIVINGTRIPS